MFDVKGIGTRGGIVVSVLVSGMFAGVVHSASSASRPASAPGQAALRIKMAVPIARGTKFLADSQRPDGGWEGVEGQSDPAISALVTKALIQHPNYGIRHPVVQRAMRFVLQFQQKDGGIYEAESGYKNYSTSVGLMMLSAAKDPSRQSNLQAAQQFLKNNQWVEGKCDSDGVPITPRHPWYGGAGYGKHQRPDLSNTQLMLEALHQSGLPADDSTYQKALTFVARCQMLSRTNDQPLARDAEDGGFIYTAANGGESKAGTVENGEKGQLRSYGSMTYAGFKSMLYAEVDRKDIRVQRAWEWIRRYYGLDSNPNMPGLQSKEGLYYYYHVFSKALDAWGEGIVIDVSGVRHDWRVELTDKLLSLQREDGSWVNEADRWYEGNPYLVTAYSLLALQTAVR